MQNLISLNFSQIQGISPNVNLVCPLQFLCFCLCSWILHSWFTRKRDVTCHHTESRPLLVLSGQTQQQPPLSPATLLVQCQCCNALVEGALENLAEIFCNLLQWLGGFLGQRKGEGEKPIKFTSRLRKNTPLPIYFQKGLCVILRFVCIIVQPLKITWTVMI